MSLAAWPLPLLGVSFPGCPLSLSITRVQHQPSRPLGFAALCMLFALESAQKGEIDKEFHVTGFAGRAYLVTSAPG